MKIGTKPGKQNNSQQEKADHFFSTKVARLEAIIQQQKKTIKHLHQADKKRLELYLHLDKKIEVLDCVRLTTPQVALLLNLGERQVRRLHKSEKLKGFQWTEQGRIQFSLPDVIAYMRQEKVNK